MYLDTVHRFVRSAKIIFSDRKNKVSIVFASFSQFLYSVTLLLTSFELGNPLGQNFRDEIRISDAFPFLTSFRTSTLLFFRK